MSFRYSLMHLIHTKVLDSRPSNYNPTGPTSPTKNSTKEWDKRAFNLDVVPLNANAWSRGGGASAGVYHWYWYGNMGVEHLAHSISHHKQKKLSSQAVEGGRCD